MKTQGHAKKKSPKGGGSAPNPATKGGSEPGRKDEAKARTKK
jgi:hypothetical protein